MHRGPDTCPDVGEGSGSTSWGHRTYGCVNGWFADGFPPSRALGGYPLLSRA